jgi:RNA polymerase sigma factor (sigma-70 family)
MTYAKVVERIGQFEWREVGLYPWLRIIALRVAIDLLRARKRERLFEPEELERHLDHAAEDAVIEPKEQEEQDLAVGRARVTELLERINPRYAQAIRLRVLEGQSREQAALDLGVTVSTFDVVLHRAVTSLRKLLSEKERGPA